VQDDLPGPLLDALERGLAAVDQRHDDLAVAGVVALLDHHQSPSRMPSSTIEFPLTCRT